jgi:hypothetical protein
VDIESRVAVVEESLRTAWREVERARERLHKLEVDRATVRLLARQVSDLSEQTPALARRAAREAVDEMLRRKHADTLSNWRAFAAFLSAGIALGSLIVYVVLR